MIANHAQAQLTRLEARRRALGMSRAVVAQRSGVPPRTVHRLLSGEAHSANFTSVLQIAEALGMTLFVEELPAQKLREQQAAEKAKKLVTMVQATSGLEGQAVSPALLGDLTEQTVHELLAGSPRRLWSE